MSWPFHKSVREGQDIYLANVRILGVQTFV